MSSPAQNTSKGKRGEDMAVAFLTKEGYTVLQRNYRYQRAEIDVVCNKGGLLVFVEVKLRYSDVYGFPEQSVGKRKQALVRSAAEHYIFENNWQKDIRFDVLAIEYKQGKYDIIHFQDAF